MDQTALDRIEAGPTRGLYDHLRSSLHAFGRYEIEAKKTSLHVTHGRAFLGVHPRKDGLLLNIVTRAPLDSPRVKKSERVSANRYHNEVLVTSSHDLDDELIAWLKTAYDLTV